ncbi:MAG: glycosyltransferase family 4 protein [Planctomycetes bacterium]|nr:glycosyltransferase family 4 protein [Planctomycetota bacterium]
MADSEAEFDVLLLTGRFEVRGSSAYSIRLASGLEQERVAARLVASDAGCLCPIERQKLAVREFSHVTTPLWGCVMRQFLWRELRQNPPALIHIQSHKVLSLGRWLAQKLQRPYVVTIHEHLSPCERGRIDPATCRQVIAVSESVRNDLINRLKVPANLVTVITSGVETQMPHGLPMPLEPGHIPVIGTASPLEIVKGLPYFLGAARQVLEVRNHVEFLVAGAGPEEANLRRMSRDLGITGQITFIPNIRSFRDALAATDIFCLPSLQQGLGTTMLEAMAFGRPVIASGVGGVASVIRDGQTGLVVPPRNSAELARRMIELLDNPTRARALGNQARRLVVEDYNVSTMVRKTAAIYRVALKPGA